MLLFPYLQTSINQGKAARSGGSVARLGNRGRKTRFLSLSLSLSLSLLLSLCLILSFLPSLWGTSLYVASAVTVLFPGTGSNLSVPSEAMPRMHSFTDYALVEGRSYSARCTF